MGMKQNQLTLILESAADEIPGALKEFFLLLMKSIVYVPLKSEPKEQIPILGSLKTEDLGFLTVPGGEEEEILPIFSEESFVTEWAEKELFYTDCEFRKLLWVLGEGTLLHLNPGQEIGKEFSRWELEQLKRGEGAIDELVAEFQGEEDEALFIQPAGPEFDKLKQKILAILEIAEELKEAFLVIAIEEESGRESPTLGIHYQKTIPAERRAYFLAEFERCSKEHLPADKGLTILDDLDDEQSESWTYFHDTTPFYVATVQPEEGESKGNIVKDIWKRLGNFRSDDEQET